MKFHNQLKSIYYFSVVAELLSIKKASEALFVTQAAISQQIRLLEEFLGIELFRRQHRSLTLTAQGKILLPYLQSAFSSIDKGMNEVIGDSDPNTITLSVFPSFASRWLIPRLGKFYKKNPDININLSMTDKYESFDDIDLAIRFRDGEFKGLKNILLMKDYLYPVCHPSYLKKHHLKTIEDLQNQRLLEDTNNYLTWSFWLHKMRINKEQFANLDNIQNIDRYDGSHYVIDSALSAQGIAMSRHSMVADAIQQNQLVKLFDMEVELNAQFYLCAPEHYFLYPKIQAFTQWIQEEVEEFITYK